MQQTLFPDPLVAHGKARHTDPDTSKAAAKSVEPQELEKRVLAMLRRFPLAGATTHEIAVYLNVELVSVSPRMRPLVNKGLVVDSGERRKGDSERKSIVWKAV